MLAYIYALITLFVVLIGHIAGNQLDWYVAVPYYDIFMHVAGGLGIGLFISAIISMHMPNAPHRWRTIIFGVLIAGIVWELFEMYYNIAGYPLWTKMYCLDTAKDLLDDVIGGSLAVWLCTRNATVKDDNDYGS